MQIHVYCDIEITITCRFANYEIMPGLHVLNSCQKNIGEFRKQLRPKDTCDYSR